jgi:hypothetical protein
VVTMTKITSDQAHPCQHDDSALSLDPAVLKSIPAPIKMDQYPANVTPSKGNTAELATMRDKLDTSAASIPPPSSPTNTNMTRDVSSHNGATDAEHMRDPREAVPEESGDPTFGIGTTPVAAIETRVTSQASNKGSKVLEVSYANRDPMADTGKAKPKALSAEI